jgi:glycosyltransferase involved in cell wall biosynthesis
MLSKQILFLSYDGMTDPLGQSQVLPYLIGLSKLGYQFTLISAEKAENYEKRKDIIAQLTQENNIDWQPISYTRKPPIISTLLDVRRMRKKALALHKQKNFAWIHCRSYISALVGEQLKKRLNIPFIFDMRGFWADERVDGGLWNLKNPLYNTVYKYFKGKEKDFLQKADHIISLTHNAKTEIEHWHLPIQKPIQVIPCCADLEHFKAPNSHSIQRRGAEGEAELGRGLVISYLGSLGTWYMLREMLDFFVELRKKYTEAHFLFITPDSPDVIYQVSDELQIPRTCFTIQKGERAEVPALLAKSHISIFFVKPAYSKKASSPTKMGEILAMGIPLIANKGIGDTDWLFEKYTCGALVENFTKEDYQKAIDALPTLMQISPANLRQTAEAYFGLEEGIRRYAEVYKKLEEKSPLKS